MFLSKRDNGFYYLWDKTPDGKKVKRSTKCTTKAEALKWLQTHKKELSRQPKQTQKSRSFRQFVIEFLEYSKPTHTLSTWKHFSTAAREFERVVGNPKLEEITSRQIERFLLIKAQEASAWTARKYFIAISSMMSKAMQWGYIPTNPFRELKRPTPPQHTPQFFTRDELQAVLTVIDDPQLTILVRVAIHTGARLGELLQLRIADLDFDRDEVHIRNRAGFVTKSKKNRVVPMSSVLKHELQQWVQQCQSELLFAREGRVRWDVSVISARFKKAVRKSALSDERKRVLSFHSIRHTFATWLLQKSVPVYSVSKLLGHSSVVVTESHYSGCIPNDFRHEVEKIVL
jgi:integrase